MCSNRNLGQQAHQEQGSMSWSNIKNELREQLKTAWPTLCTLIMYRFPWLISLRFVGGLGAEELAAAALATTLCNVTGLSLSVGMSSAMTTLTSQARGDLMALKQKQTRRKGLEDTLPLLAVEKNRNGGNRPNYQSTKTSLSEVDSIQTQGKLLLPMVFLYQGVLIQLVLFGLPIGCWWLSGIESTLLALGQDRNVSLMTAQYLQVLAPGFWAYSISNTMTTWLQALEMADVPAYGAAIGLVLHVPINYFFIYFLDFGFLGCAAATSTFQILQPTIIVFYLFATTRGRTRLFENTCASCLGRKSVSSNIWDDFNEAVMSYDGVKQYLKLAGSGIVNVSEWWASELAIFLAGRLQPHPALALGGISLYQSINHCCFMFPVSIAVAGSTRVGNLLGSGNETGAALASKVSVANAMILGAALGVGLLVVPRPCLPSLFTSETAVIYETSRLIPFLAIYLFADGTQVALNGTIKGCGRQCVTIPIVIFAYWIVGLPLGYYMSFLRNGGTMCGYLFCGDRGLVFGMTVGTWVHMFLMSFVVARTDWAQEGIKAKERLLKPTDTVGGSLETNTEPELAERII